MVVGAIGLVTPPLRAVSGDIDTPVSSCAPLSGACGLNPTGRQSRVFARSVSRNFAAKLSCHILYGARTWIRTRDLYNVNVTL